MPKLTRICTIVLACFLTLSGSLAAAQGPIQVPTVYQPTAGANKLMFTGHFTSAAYKTVVLYFPSDGSWWLGKIGSVGGVMSWNKINANTPGWPTGSVGIEGWPIFVGNWDNGSSGLDEFLLFSGSGWFLGTLSGNTLTFSWVAGTPTF